MSRIGKKIIIVPEGVNVDVAADNTVTVTGPKGTLTRKFSDLITIEVMVMKSNVRDTVKKKQTSSYMVQLEL